jgi:hypothetical protein
LVKFTEYCAGVQAGIGQITAERKQTYSLLQEALSRLASTAVHVRKGRIHRAYEELFPKSFKGVANFQLAMQFGVKPLISDINDIVELSSGSLDFNTEAFRRRRKRSFPRELLSTTTNGGVTTNVYESGSVEVKYRIVARVKAGPVLSALKLGLGPLSLAWELTPWSFVVDWLLPVGDAIEQAEMLTAVEPTSITRTTVIRRIVEVEKTFSGAAGNGYTWNLARTYARFDYFSCQRQLLPSLPAVQVFVLDERPLRNQRLFNALALLRQKLPR